MAPLCALGESRDHRATSRHVDPRRQGFGGEHHLDKSLLEQLLNQFLPGGQDSGMVSSDPPQQSIGMEAVPHSFRICLAV